MFSIGSTIRDRQGNQWTVAQTWTYEEYLCLALVGVPNTPVEGQMGGARFRSGDEIFIRH
jgi:hypothetical protein